MFNRAMFTSVLLAIAWAHTSGAQRAHDELLRALGSSNNTERREAVAYIRQAVPREQRAELEVALAVELQRLNDAMRERIEADRAGQPLTDDFPDGYYHDVAELVSQSQNPAVLPALAGALGTGSMVQNAIAKFGDPAVSHVVRAAQLPVGLVTTGKTGDVPPYVVSSALTTLRVLLTHHGASLSNQSRAMIEAVARERLAGRQDGGVVAAACQLAAATRNDALRRRVVQLIEQPSELAGLGLDEKWVQFVQTVARKALAAH